MHLSWRLGTFACLLLSLHVLARPGDDDKASISSGEYFMSQTSSQDRREEAATQAAEGSHNAAPAAAGGSPAPRGSFSPTSSDDRNFAANVEDWDKKQRAAKLKTYAEAVKNDKSGGVGPVQVHSDGSHLHYTAPGQLPHPHDDHAQVVGNAEAHGRIQSFHHAAAAANVAHNEAYPDRTGNPFPYPSSILPGNAPGATSALSVDPKTPGGSSRPTTFGSSSKGSNYLPPNSQIAQVQRETTARLHNDDIKKAGSSSGPVPKRTVARSGACSENWTCLQHEGTHGPVLPTQSPRISTVADNVAPTNNPGQGDLSTWTHIPACTGRAGEQGCRDHMTTARIGQVKQTPDPERTQHAIAGLHRQYDGLTVFERAQAQRRDRLAPPPPAAAVQADMDRRAALEAAQNPAAVAGAHKRDRSDGSSGSGAPETSRRREHSPPDPSAGGECSGTADAGMAPFHRLRKRALCAWKGKKSAQQPSKQPSKKRVITAGSNPTHAKRLAGGRGKGRGKVQGPKVVQRQRKPVAGKKTVAVGKVRTAGGGRVSKGATPAVRVRKSRVGGRRPR